MGMSSRTSAASFARADGDVVEDIGGFVRAR
jgi:hypothetical protein